MYLYLHYYLLVFVILLCRSILHILIYYNEHTRGGCRIEVPHAEAFHAEWFDPRTGRRDSLEASLIPADGWLDCPGRTQGGDWMLVLQAA